MTFSEIVAKINAGQREAVGCTPPVCEVYNAATDDDGRLLVNAILGFEVTAGRKVRPDDEAAVMAEREALRANMTKPMVLGRSK